ncbi:MAG: hypothetical protein K6F85_04945 [Bacteroidales bacterium]|nr:hypothetical protein [Bacteroidales bacterium]
MKKVIIAIVAIFALGTANAQIQDLGIRGAFGSGAGAELSAMWGLGGNRLETDLGWSGGNHWSYINLSGVYQWTWELGGDFGWFAGVGANVGIYSSDVEGYDSGLGLGVLGQIGLEFNPSAIPFQFTLDFRPQWDFVGHSGFGYAGALGIRYRF